MYQGGRVSCQAGGVSHCSGGGDIRDGGVDGVSHQSCQGADGVSLQGGGDSSEGGTLYQGGRVSCQPGGVSHCSGGGDIRDGGVSHQSCQGADGVSHQGGSDSSDGTMHQNGVSNQGDTLYQGGGVSCQPGGVSHSSDDDNASDELVQNHVNLLHKLKDIQFNWFEFVDSFCCHIESSKLHMYYDHFFQSDDLNQREKALLQQSYLAFVHDEEFCKPICEREALAFSGQVVSDSEEDNDNDEQYIGLTDINDPRVKALYLRYHSSIQRHARYLRNKVIAEHNFLCKKRSQKVSKIISDCDNIGKVIEEFVEERNIGADAWRRTGVLTFDGNTKVKEKVTYKRIQQHLEQVYKRKFGYGTVVQLCIARNKRRLSSKRYKGLAKVTSRRARKGFQLKYNPDAHWSSALYRGLNLLQYTDGSNIVNINRDDAAGFRLDTMATHRLHRTPALSEHKTLTTYTDYVNKYPSTIQTTSYNFTGTKTTKEICVGVVKATAVFPKNPTQHAADLKMLEHLEPTAQAFVNPLTKTRKCIECIRVDGASDEGPSHEEVQFLWTERHLVTGCVATLVSARNSGASYLNRVELQNGCLSLGHANLFIPSTLGGTCMDATSGKVDPLKLAHNMELATEVYINRVNGCPCGETTIQLFKGADSTREQERRQHLMLYLKGSNKEKKKLKELHPEMYEYFKNVCDLQVRHMVKDLPSQYLFYLVCCLKTDCQHPVCTKGLQQLPTWFCGGPSIAQLPLPIADPERPYGGKCSECKDHCFGHFMLPLQGMQASATLTFSKPPSVVLKEIFDMNKEDPISAQVVQEAAKKVLLPPEEVLMWFHHLDTIAKVRKNAAIKAASTRKQNAEKKQSQLEQQSYCGVCREMYKEYTTTVENWICCDTCQTWFHFECVRISKELIPEHYSCDNCC